MGWKCGEGGDICGDSELDISESCSETVDNDELGESGTEVLQIVFQICLVVEEEIELTSVVEAG